jgi:2-polyprenyl-3-methyl-5-hydroxy-6-metoxy-1,4-benzoquinol methylase
MRAVRRVYGVELDPGFAQEAATRLDGVLCADVEAMDWASVHAGNQFDCIVFADVLEHLRDPRRQLAGARARLAPGGCIVTSLPNIRHISAFAAIFLGGHFPARPRGIFDRTHLRWFTIADARAMFAEAGFEIEAMDFAMRKGDQGGGRVNRLLNRLPRALRGWWLLREFFTYQFSFRARVKQ